MYTNVTLRYVLFALEIRRDVMREIDAHDCQVLQLSSLARAAARKHELSDCISRPLSIIITAEWKGK